MYSANEQLRLPFPGDRDFVKSLFERVVGKSVRLTITDNSTSMLSVRNSGGVVAVRLHRIFLSAGIEVISEAAEFIKRRKGATPGIRAFIKANEELLPSEPARGPRVRTLGGYNDLKEIYESVNREYFNESVNALITWGVRKKVGHGVRKRTLGSYNSRNGVIRISPLLDRESVPRYFLEFIVYHEMLHADMGVEKKNNRRYAHSKAFRLRERLFKDYGRAIEWEKSNGF